MAFLFQRPPLALSSSPLFYDESAEVARVPENIWRTLLIADKDKVTLSITRYAGNKHSGTSGVPSITCRAVLDRDVSTLRSY